MTDSQPKIRNPPKSPLECRRGNPLRHITSRALEQFKFGEYIFVFVTHTKKRGEVVEVPLVQTKFLARSESERYASQFSSK